ncbi:MAG: hypothetical protein D6724_05840 [Armatimonadetes bacterium]|nr:MAG: hypothetical protein D6724_05840 [Armatimonadota bacterium]
MIVALLLYLVTPVIEIQPEFVLAHPPLSEVSGMVASRQYAGVSWVHNDSGDVARIFAVRADGTVVMPPGQRDRYEVAPVWRWAPGVELPRWLAKRDPWPGVSILDARNVDWEDIALYDGKLYIGDVGNNGNSRTDLTVYVVPEPNPYQTTQAAATLAQRLRYPDQKEFPGTVRRFDCEALFVWRSKLYFITKWRADNSSVLPIKGAALYSLRLPLAGGTEPAVLDRVSVHADFPGWVTAADLSPDGHRLAVLSLYPSPSLLILSEPESGEDWLAAPRRTISIPSLKQAESVTWLDGKTVLIVNEQRELFRVRL